MKNISGVLFLLFASLGLIAEAAIPANYYNQANGKSGTVNLLTALQQTVGNHTVVSYAGLWDLYKTTDVDANGKIWDMYSTKRWTPGGEQCGNYSNVGDCYNREHSMPKSWFNDASPMVSDAFHIYPTDGKVNGQRGNYPFGECANGKNLGTYNGVKALGKLGTSSFSGYSGTVFEPDDEYKGDFARSYFYMAAAYYDKTKSWSSDMLSNDNNVFTTWAINLLLKWHRQDPVSDKELNRNEAVYAAQKNRNPFIDHPELAEYIWGNKKGEAWNDNIDLGPEINSPLDGTTIDLGVTSLNSPISQTISVKGSNLNQNVAVSVNSADFSLSSSSLSYSSVNSGSATLTITFKSASVKSSSATLTLTSGSATAKVILNAQAVSGIPALEATDVDEDSFTARWTPVGSEATYSLNVCKNNVSIAGYPRQVTAAAGSYSVTGLESETTYTYSLSSSNLTSNVVTVTTLKVMPSIEVLNDETLEFEQPAGETSGAKEVWFAAENINSDISVSVQKPFSLSTDKTSFAQSIIVRPDDERFYIRLEAAEPGEYSSSILFTANDYVYDDATVKAKVRDVSKPWFIETFEVEEDKGNYNDGSFTGSTGVWNVTDFGLWKADAAHNGNYAGRFGNSSSSSITTAKAKEGGIGSVTFFAQRWSEKDGDASFDVQYSPDGSDWTTAGNVTVNSDDYAQYTVPVNVTGNNYIRIRQTSGKRAMIDDLTVTDVVNSVGTIVNDEKSGWDAFCRGGSLIIEISMEMPRRFVVYAIDGTIRYSSTLSKGEYTISLPAGIYLVGAEKSAKKVIVK